MKIEEAEMRKGVYVNIGKRSGKAYRRASELVQEIFEIYPNQTIFVLSLENYQEMMAKERCRAIDDFAEMLKNRIDANMKQVLKHNLDLDMANLDKSDIDEVARDIKGVNE